MLFNSVEFALFFIIVFSLYSLLRHKQQNAVLLVASYVFYGAWDWRFLLLLVFTTCVDWACGLAMERTTADRKRKWLLGASIASNFTVLGFFKYYGFFAQQMEVLLRNLGLGFHLETLQIVLPVGISFYTFQALSYTIDVYRKKVDAVKSLPDFALYVSFFPQLVAGPIERAHDLLPQMQRPRTISWGGLRVGAYLFLWGLFKKCVIADNLAPLANSVFNDIGSHNIAEIWVGTLAFAFQIYGDFSGYSDMARGLASAMGFQLTNNFNHPYFASNVQDFWHRWHITLSRWFRDYLYIPLGGNRQGNVKTYRNIFITMTLAGLWHGASWHFVAWGVYHGMLLVFLRILDPAFSKIKPSRIWKFLGFLVTFHLVCFGWVLFRAPSLASVLAIGGVLYKGIPLTLALLETAGKVALFCSLLIALEWLPFVRNDSTAYLQSPFLARTAYYTLILFLLVLYGAPLGEPFIYFQF